MYQAIPLEDVKNDVKSQWDALAKTFTDKDTVEIAEDDTERSLNNGRYTDVIVNTETNEYVALIGIVKAEMINCHKVLDVRLNPASNPDYRDEQQIGLLSAASEIAGTISAFAAKGIIEAGMQTVKIFGRGHDMKTFFKIVEEEWAKHPLSSELKVFNQAGWLVIENNLRS